MRIGNNPLRFQPAPSSIKDIVFLVVTHLPDNSNGQYDGYHKDRLDVVKTCLTTMRENSKREHTFFVWDNGSGEEFRWWLQSQFGPDMLMFSNNIGKNNARASAIQMLPINSIVCYSDDDILYSDNWLEPQLDLLFNFPNVAAVSGYPIRTMFRWGNINTLEWARKNAKLEQGRFISVDDEKDYCNSIGRDYQEHVASTLKDIDYRITHNNRKAYATAHHCQFIGFTVKVQQAMTNDGMAMGDEKPLDIKLDQLGLRLCTTQRLTRHIGNVLDDKLRMELQNNSYWDIVKENTKL